MKVPSKSKKNIMKDKLLPYDIHNSLIQETYYKMYIIKRLFVKPSGIPAQHMADTAGTHLPSQICNISLLVLHNKSANFEVPVLY